MASGNGDMHEHPPTPNIKREIRNKIAFLCYLRQSVITVLAWSTTLNLTRKVLLYRVKRRTQRLNPKQSERPFIFKPIIFIQEGTDLES